ncbi:MAG: hypothetical protein WBW74_15280 [Xanthobacteraceae bacterium]
MQEQRPHWWLAATVIFFGVLLPVIIFEVFGIDPDAALAYLVACAVAAGVYGALMAVIKIARRERS